MAQSLHIWSYLVYKDPLLTYLLVSEPSILTLKYLTLPILQAWHILSRTDGWNLHANILLLQQPQHGAYLHGAILGSGSSNKLSLAHSRWLRMCFSHIHSPPSCTSNKHTEFVNFMSHFHVANKPAAQKDHYLKGTFCIPSNSSVKFMYNKSIQYSNIKSLTLSGIPGPFGGRCYILRDLSQTNPTKAGKWIQTTQQKKQRPPKKTTKSFLRIPTPTLHPMPENGREAVFVFWTKTAVFVRWVFWKKQGCYNKLWLIIYIYINLLRKYFASKSK